MSLSRTLARAEHDAERGDLGKARDRLEGLLVGYPDALEIRYRLGDIYWKLQYPERAGRHWYLFETDRPEMDAAKSAFEARYGGDPWLMLDAIAYHGGLDALNGTHADTVIRDLAKRSGVTPARLQAALRRRNPNEPPPPEPTPWWDRVIGPAIVAAVVLFLILACVGTITTVNSIRMVLSW